MSAGGPAPKALVFDQVSFDYGARPVAQDAKAGAAAAGSDAAGSAGRGRAGVRAVDLAIEAGECVLVCGASGCGKTTLTKLANGLIPHVEVGWLEGTVRVFGLDTAKCELWRIAELVASVFQNPKSQFFNVDPQSEITFGLENRGLDAGYVRARLRAAVQDLGIEGLLDSSMFSLSGGEKQIIAFACAYASDAPLIALDESSANLDAGATAAIARIIARLKARGKSILVAEHRLGYLAGLLDRAVILHDGRVERVFAGEDFRALDAGALAGLGLREIAPVFGLAAPAPPQGPGAPLYGPVAGPTLEASGLACGQRGRPVFDKVSLCLESGQVTAIVGANGVGKSTLVRCLCGLKGCEAGRISFGGKAVGARRRRGLSYLVMQDVNRQLFGSTVLEECLLGSPDAARGQAEAVLERLGLGDVRDADPLDLSGGQKQRLAVASAMLAGRQALFFDEPTSGLDLASMAALADVLRDLADEGAVVCVVTHDAELIRRVCTRCILLEEHGARRLGSDEVASVLPRLSSRAAPGRACEGPPAVDNLL